MAMVELDPDLALGELVTDHPPLASRLELLGLDYCCGGQRSLRDAVAATDLDLGDVMAALAAVDTDAPREGWAELGPAELVDHIEATHHAYLHEALPRLQALAAKVEAVHAGRHPELGQVARLVVAIRADLEPHLQKEEQVLFPMIRQLAAATAAPTFHCGTVANPITVMLQEHDRAGELLAQLRAATSGFEVPADGCASYRALYDGLAELEADTHLHVHKENNVLFPAVLELEASLGALDAP
jgi:regulator of cell morphogenesis and NO signaling